MHNPFKKKEIQPKEEKPLKFSDITDIETVSMEQFHEMLKQEPTNQLSARVDTLKRHFKTMTFKPLETVEEKQKRRRKINTFIGIIETEITKRRATKAKTDFANDKLWNEENVPKLLPNIRYCLGANVTNLRKGLINISIPQWQTPETTIIKIGDTQFDLMRIHPQEWKSLIQRKFTPAYFSISGTKTGAKRNGKEMDRWRSGRESFIQNKKIKLVPSTYLALMVV